jgi:8-oxo-dGTP pyrophosphatase MutT (NUDIX family)
MMRKEGRSVTGRSGSLQEAAVLVPVYRHGEDGITVVLVRRSGWGIHGGQIALPGGTREPADSSLQETALREAHEEIGLEAATTQILEQLTVVETHTTGFRISPFLARIERPARWRRQEREIDEILEVPIADLGRPEAEGRGSVDLPDGGTLERQQFYRVGGHKLWGATHRILRPLLPRLLAGEWEI